MQISNTSPSILFSGDFPEQKKTSNFTTDLYAFSQRLQFEFQHRISSVKLPKITFTLPNAIQSKIDQAASVLAPYKVSTKLPRDKDLVMKKLDNGVTYYVRHNNQPFAQKAYLRLIIRVGMLNETPQEKGIAHLIEHIAQVETEKFAKDQIMNYLSSKGVHWARDNNAYTAPEETVYKLDIPLDDPETLEHCLSILSEVASKATLSEEIINNEREIVIDELTQGRGPWTTFANKKRCITCEGTPYATLVDRDKEIKSVKECPADVIQAFYKRWYQPENMAVIAVGDFDPKKTAALIEKHFGKIPSLKLPPSEHNYHLNVNPGSRFLCFSDPEIIYSVVEIFHQLPKLKHATEMQAQQMSLVIDMFQDLLHDRLEDIIERDDSPFVEIDCSEDDIIPDYPYFKLLAIAKENQIPQAFKQLLIEIKRIKSHGFSQNEFDRVKKKYFASIEHGIQEKSKTSCNRFVKLYHAHFRDDTIMSDVNKMGLIKKQLVEKITLNDLNAAAAYLMPEKNRLISTATPEKADLTPITEDILKQEITNIEKENVEPLIDEVVNLPLLKRLPKPGKISSTKLHKKANVTEYTLQNGMRVFVKPTTFKNDEVLIKAYSIDGTRDADISALASAKFSNDFFDACGIGDFDNKTLNKVLNGKNVNFSASVGSYITTIRAASVPKDLETAFQLIHLMFTNPGYDQAVFKRTLEKTEEVYRNQHNNPSKLFSNEIINTITQGHPEFKPMAFEDFKSVDYDTCKNFHQKNFSNPANFTIAIVGNVQLQNVKRLAESYFASLSKTGEQRKEFIYSPVPFPKGIIHKIVRAGKETSGTTMLTFPAPINDSIKERLLSSWCSEILELRLNKVLRFEAGITYSQSCTFANTSLPGLNPNNSSKAIIVLTGDPANHPTLEKLLIEQIQDLQTNGPTESEIADFKKSTASAYSNGKIVNSIWMEDILTRNIWGHEQDNFDSHEKDLEKLTAAEVKEQFNKIFHLDNYVAISHLPTEAPEKA